MCPLCPCSGTTAQYGGGGGACVPYLPVVVLQHSMEEEEHEPSAAGACQCDSRSCVVSTTSQLLCGYKGFVVLLWQYLQVLQNEDHILLYWMQ